MSQAYKHFKIQKSLDIVDPSLASSVDVDQVAVCIQIGLLCTQADRNLRPAMRSVVIMLSKKPGTLEEPTRPGYPGARYNRRSGKPNAASSTAGTTGEYDSQSFGSTTNTNSASSSKSAPSLDDRGKRPMQS